MVPFPRVCQRVCPESAILHVQPSTKFHAQIRSKPGLAPCSAQVPQSLCPLQSSIPAQDVQLFTQLLPEEEQGR